MAEPMQMRVARFVAEHDLGKPAAYGALDLVSEVGEVAKAILSATEYGRYISDAALVAARPELAEELGDALYSLLDLANALGVDAEAALDAALAKYAARLATRGRAASS